MLQAREEEYFIEVYLRNKAYLEIVMAFGLSRNQMTRPIVGSVSFKSLRVVQPRAAVSETSDQSFVSKWVFIFDSVIQNVCMHKKIQVTSKTSAILVFCFGSLMLA